MSKIAIIRVDNDWEFEEAYTTLEELSSALFKVFFEMHNSPESYDSITIEWEPGKIAKWNDSLGHYCFAHGSLSESDFVKAIFLNEELITEGGKSC